MTQEQLLYASADQLEAISEEELTKLLAPKFNLTRPDIVNIKSVSERNYIVGVKTKEEIETAQKKKRAAEIAKRFGMDLKF